MSAQSSLKALAGAVIGRTMQRTLPAQNEETARTLGAHCNAHLEALQIETIRSWLFKINEPVEDHDIVLNKCRSDHEALEYFLKHAQGEFDEE